MNSQEIKEKFGLNSWKEVLYKQFEYLDKIDFKPYIEKYEDLDELWDAIEDDYDNTELSNDEFLQGWIFNWLDHYELTLYLREKYNVDYKEYTITQFLRDSI